MSKYCITYGESMGTERRKHTEQCQNCWKRYCPNNNMNTAYKRVCANKGAGGVDEVTVEELGDYIKENWARIRNQIRSREYKPQPVRRVEIKSESSAKRVMRTVSDWIQRKLGLKVNMTKTHITRPTKLKYLGFGFYKDSKTKEWKCRPHQDSVKKFKDRLKELTCRKMPGTVTSKIEKINQVTRGWINYYALGSMKTAMTEVDAHLRTRLRVVIWKQWKTPGKRQWGLQKMGVGKDLARLTAYCGDRYYWVATKTCAVRAISKEVLAKAGLISCLDYYNERHALKLC